MLLTHTVTINGARFDVAEDFDIAQLKDTLARAVTYDANYVDFDTATGHRISVLVTAATKICFDAKERLAIRALATEDPGFEAEFVDFDDYPGWAA